MTKLFLLLLLGALARAEDTPPPPPNPFANMPSEKGFSPFEDDFDGGDDFGEAPAPRGNPMNPGANSGGGTASVSRGGVTVSNPAPRQGGGISTPKMDPANSKDTVENFDYPDAEILDVAKAIAKLTGKSLIYNPQDIKGRISIVSETTITVGDAWNAFLTALNMKGFALVPSGKYLRIERVASAKEKQTPIYADRKPPNNDEFITRVIPLRYIDATEFEQTFRLWMPREARMQAYGQTNTLIITDTAAHINRMMELINLLDVAGYQESLVVIPVKNAPAKDIAKLIEQILNDSKGASSPYGVPGRPAANYGSQGRSTTKGRTGGSVISKIIADDRTNMLIVKANAAGIMEIRALVRRLDSKVAANEGSGRIHVIQLQFADAEQMAKTLSAITSGAGNKSQTRAFPGAFGSDPVPFQNEIKVSPDKMTQSLVISASPQDYITFKKVVESLDVPRDQVFIEAMILEVALNRDNNFGTSFVSASNGIGLPSASGALTDLLSGNPLAGAGGLILGFKSGAQKADVEVGSGDNKKTFHVNSLNGLVELIQGNSDANVIATPKIVALDNEKATFEMKQTVPVPTTTTAANGGSIGQSFSPDSVTVSLTVTPQINKASNFVKLEIDQKFENFDNTNVPLAIRNTANGKNQRATNTKAIVQNEDTIVLSGFIQDQVKETVNKVPLLGDIPILGWLFKNSQKKVQKTNLLVFITPTIIKQYDQVRKVLNKNLDERDEFIRENVGSRDFMSKKIARLKGSLPDLTVIEPMARKRPQESTSFPMPSSPDREEDYEDPNMYYPPEGVYNLPPVDNVPQPEITMPDNMPAPPVVPDPQFGE